jgi:hypothetical protein
VCAQEEKHWLCPVEDRRRIDSPREGMIEGCSLGNYLLLVNFTARLYREGKPRCRANWPRSSTALAAASITGAPGWRSCARAVSWGASSRPAASVSVTSPNVCA